MLSDIIKNFRSSVHKAKYTGKFQYHRNTNTY